MQVKALWFSYLPCHTSHQKINTILKLCDLTTRVLQRALLVPVQLVHKLYTQPLCFMPFGFNTPCQFTSLPNLHSLICGFTPFGWLHSIILSLFVMGISFFIYASLIYAHFSGTQLGHKKRAGHTTRIHIKKKGQPRYIKNFTYILMKVMYTFI
jgi:hypothetical protein